jgi:hypothetical protein
VAPVGENDAAFHKHRAGMGSSEEFDQLLAELLLAEHGFAMFIPLGKMKSRQRK